MGHIVNEKIPNSSPAKVVQRKDVDSFYGSHFEAGFIALVQARARTIEDVVFDDAMRRKVRPRVMLGEQECGYHQDRGHVADYHTQVPLISSDNRVLNLVLHMERAELAAVPASQIRVLVEHDARVFALVSLIKAAYLTLFQLLGYQYVLSCAGMSIGHGVLGAFYRDNRGKNRLAIHAAAIKYFQPYIHMVRPAESCIGTIPAGTVDDRQAMLCIGSSGKLYGLIVFVKTDSLVSGVLMPAYDNPESGEAYLSFLSNDNETLHAHRCEFRDDGTCHVVRTPIVMHWPKKDGSCILE